MLNANINSLVNFLEEAANNNQCAPADELQQVIEYVKGRNLSDVWFEKIMERLPKVLTKGSLDLCTDVVIPAMQGEEYFPRQEAYEKWLAGEKAA
jgi:hypothetical protein